MAGLNDLAAQWLLPKSFSIRKAVNDKNKSGI